MITAGNEQSTAIPAAVPVAVVPPAPAHIAAPSFALKEAVVTAPAASLIEHIKQNAPTPVAAPVAVSPPVAAVPPTAPIAKPAAAPAISPEAAWAKVIALAPGRSQKALLAKLTLESVTAGTAVVAAPHDCLELAQAADAEIEASLVNILGRRVKVEIRDAGKPAVTGEAPAPPPPNSMIAVETNPLIKRATELFGARIVSVQPRRPAATPAPLIPAAPAPLPRESDEADAAAIETTGDE